MKAIGKVAQWALALVGLVTVLYTAYLYAGELLSAMDYADELDCE